MIMTIEASFGNIGLLDINDPNLEVFTIEIPYECDHDCLTTPYDYNDPENDTYLRYYVSELVIFSIENVSTNFINEFRTKRHVKDYILGMRYAMHMCHDLSEMRSRLAKRKYETLIDQLVKICIRCNGYDTDNERVAKLIRAGYNIGVSSWADITSLK